MVEGVTSSKWYIDPIELKIGIETKFNMEVTRIMISKGCGSDVIKYFKMLKSYIMLLAKTSMGTI